MRLALHHDVGLGLILSAATYVHLTGIGQGSRSPSFVAARKALHARVPNPCTVPFGFFLHACITST